LGGVRPLRLPSSKGSEIESTRKRAKKKAGFEVVTGVRRLAALNRLARKKRIAADYPVPRHLVSDGDAIEVSLAENVVWAPLHPADQYEAFLKLNNEGLVVEEFAARFGVKPTHQRQVAVVRSRSN